MCNRMPSLLGYLFLRFEEYISHLDRSCFNCRFDRLTRKESTWTILKPYASGFLVILILEVKVG